MQPADRIGQRSLDGPGRNIFFLKAIAQFEDPRRMIDGLIPPPVVYLSNYPIARRHVHSVAFAAFERLKGGHRTVGEFFTAPTDTDSAASEAFIEWLRTKPQFLGEALGRILPIDVAQHIGSESWAWVEALVKASDDEPTQG